MPSFDVVSKLDMQEIDNSISNSMKEITQRYDFKGSNSKIERSDKIITLTTEDELKAKQVLDILNGHIIKRNVDTRSIKLKNSESASGNTIRQTFDLIEGVDQDTSKKIISTIKSSKMKVQVKIQGNELRVSGAKRDNLQEAIQIIKDLDLPVPLQYINFRD
ncbi:MAG: YajQ family cyclic di-GMP-binding protein [Pelagibacterales bacterium]|nr:YajQ family cyclic di-GMP-binding protein [Pelagibacterales bacterium]